MDDILAMSLAFHIIFAVIGIGMPLLMTIAEWRWLRTKDEIYLTLAKRWAKGTAIFSLSAFYTLWTRKYALARICAAFGPWI